MEEVACCQDEASRRCCVTGFFVSDFSHCGFPRSIECLMFLLISTDKVCIFSFRPAFRSLFEADVRRVFKANDVRLTGSLAR